MENDIEQVKRERQYLQALAEKLHARKERLSDLDPLDSSNFIDADYLEQLAAIDKQLEKIEKRSSALLVTLVKLQNKADRELAENFARSKTRDDILRDTDVFRMEEEKIFPILKKPKQEEEQQQQEMQIESDKKEKQQQQTTLNPEDWEGVDVNQLNPEDLEGVDVDPLDIDFFDRPSDPSFQEFTFDDEPQYDFGDDDEMLRDFLKKPQPRNDVFVEEKDDGPYYMRSATREPRTNKPPILYDEYIPVPRDQKVHLLYDLKEKQIPRDYKKTVKKYGTEETIVFEKIVDETTFEQATEAKRQRNKDVIEYKNLKPKIADLKKTLKEKEKKLEKLSGTSKQNIKKVYNKQLAAYNEMIERYKTLKNIIVYPYSRRVIQIISL